MHCSIFENPTVSLDDNGRVDTLVDKAFVAVIGHAYILLLEVIRFPL
jgi:hypothetical protein